jgi:hypothetical protein
MFSMVNGGVSNENASGEWMATERRDVDRITQKTEDRRADGCRTASRELFQRFRLTFNRTSGNCLEETTEW